MPAFLRGALTLCPQLCMGILPRRYTEIGIFQVAALRHGVEQGAARGGGAGAGGWHGGAAGAAAGLGAAGLGARVGRCRLTL